MTTAVLSAALAAIQPPFRRCRANRPRRGSWAGYRGLTREAYALDLGQFTTWCRGRSLALFAVRRADIEGFAWDLEAQGRAWATVTRRPPIGYESHAAALDRDEFGALLAGAGFGPPGTR